MVTQKTTTQESESELCDKCGSPMAIYHGAEFISAKNYKGIKVHEILQCKVCRFWRKAI